MKFLKAIPRDIVQDKTVDELCEYTREVMKKSSRELNKTVTTEMLSKKVYSFHMWVVFCICMYEVILWIYLWKKLFVWIFY